MPLDDSLLALLILLAALLYSSVGHAGASGYLAAMALMGVAPAVMRPSALALNVLVALVASAKFYRAGAFSWRLCWPLVLASVPCAYLGGTLHLPSALYKPLIGAVLVYAAWRSLRTAHAPARQHAAQPPLRLLLLTGAVLGFLSGLTGVGGGIFLSPLMLFFGWAPLRVISGVSAVFILLNSAAGLLGVLQTATQLPSALPMWAAAALLGGWVGASYGSQRLGNPRLHQLLALVLLIAGFKMLAGV